ncbi:UDP-glycosyltransferase 82A1-like [Zingiber officinale]|uniref:Glycosyltransferase n=1 Tax=Zingiber officinale TaxID=94328 RepID=A0A8J5H2C0_ZINOF|nr:UDP-glycosyltransferase 82A1-like [Zingiber officinale]XP_042472522.1 UDP-glycosyltransferase 82A1-like [Zingiber officinale]KAG6519491.1 hypothetical protein ZIOFF_022985 [Zingiber officinale]KAG6519494.1 hypothetical protein ZIOFF_022988 [Zingiber officinale]
MARSRFILVPFPAQGHVTAMLRLGRLLNASGFDVTMATPDFIHRRLAGSADAGDVRHACLPSGLPEADHTAEDSTAIVRAMECHMPPHLERLLLADGDGAVACVVVDLAASWAIPVAKRCGVPVVAGFWPAMLASYRAIAAIPELIRRGFISEQDGSFLRHQSQSKRELETEELEILAVEAKLSLEDLPWLAGDSAVQNLRFKFWLQVVDRAKSLQFVLVNTFPGEAGGGGHLLSPEHRSPRALPIGPLMAHERVPRPNLWEEDESCLAWLKNQPPGSVVYVSFGSWVAPLSPATISEFALGLEAAGAPFLWALRDDARWRAGLPAGFAGRGGRLVVDWAPQEAVLASPAVGCFLTHCGWLSAVEAALHGKRMLCYPIAGDHFVNAAQIAGVWGAGIRLEEGCGCGDVAEGIRRVMGGKEGEKVQKGVEELRRKVVEEKGSAEAMANLQSFLDASKLNE